MLYIFQGGVMQLLLDVKKNREILFHFHGITGNNFMELTQALKIMHQKDRNANARDITIYNRNKKNMSDEEFINYIKEEFTKGVWEGFELKHKIKND